MGVEKISEKIDERCNNDPNMKSMLRELFQFQLEDRGWWKEPYREIIEKYAKKGSDYDEN